MRAKRTRHCQWQCQWQLMNLRGGAHPFQLQLQGTVARMEPSPDPLIKRVKACAYLFLILSLPSVLGGSLLSAIFALFLYFGVIRGIPRGNRKALRCFACCSCC